MSTDESSSGDQGASAEDECFGVENIAIGDIDTELTQMGHLTAGADGAPVRNHFQGRAAKVVQLGNVQGDLHI
jgi:hypothetical protein